MQDGTFHFSAGPVGVLLVHGLTGTPSEMKGFGRALAGQGVSVRGVRLAGHCGSEADLVRSHWRDWSQSVEEAFEALSASCATVFVGGLSMGALLSIRLAATKPDKVAGLLLLSTTLFYDGWAIPRHRFLLRPALAMGLARWIRFEETEPYGIKDDRVRRRVVKAMRRGDVHAAGNVATPGRSLLELQGLIRQVKEDLPRVRAPALVVHARHDDLTSLRNAEYVCGRIGGPSELLVLENSYHMVTLDGDRRLLVDRAANFISRRTATVRRAAAA